MRTRELKRLKDLLQRYAEETGSASAKDIAASIESAETRIKRSGRKTKYSAEINSLILDMMAAGKSIRDIARVTGCSIGYVQNQKAKMPGRK